MLDKYFLAFFCGYYALYVTLFGYDLYKHEWDVGHRTEMRFDE